MHSYGNHQHGFVQNVVIIFNKVKLKLETPGSIHPGSFLRYFFRKEAHLNQLFGSQLVQTNRAYTHTIVDASPVVGRTPGKPEKSRWTKAQNTCRPYRCTKYICLYICWAAGFDDLANCLFSFNMCLKERKKERNVLKQDDFGPLGSAVSEIRPFRISKFSTWFSKYVQLLSC